MSELLKQSWFPWAAVYLLVMNLIGFSLMGTDKRRARRHVWRIPEKTLFLAAILGGSLGAWAGMYSGRTDDRGGLDDLFVSAESCGRTGAEKL